MKVVLFYITLFTFVSCSQKRPALEIKDNKSSAVGIGIGPIEREKVPKQFECGTSNIKYFSDILEEWENTHPRRVKNFYFEMNKKNAGRFFDLLKNSSLELSHFDRTALDNFPIPRKTDTLIFTGPIDQFCFIRQNSVDSIPVKISFSLDDNKRFIVELASDSTIVNKLAGIIAVEKLGMQKSKSDITK